jgi:hypothetical protein
LIEAMHSAARRGRGVLILVDALPQDKKALQLWICAALLFGPRELTLTVVRFAAL